jgi:hypothetical protein
MREITLRAMTYCFGLALVFGTFSLASEADPPWQPPPQDTPQAEQAGAPAPAPDPTPTPAPAPAPEPVVNGGAGAPAPAPAPAPEPAPPPR